MAKHPNLSAYDDVENLTRFTEETFIMYCNDKLKECNDEVRFIKRNCINDQWQGKVCEIGSGNSKLLYNLEKANLIKKGIGYETSKSRYLFAEKFKKHINSNKTHNVNNDFLKEDPLQEFDLVIGVDIVFQLIAPLFDDAEADSLQWIYKSLRPGGCLLLELKDFNDFNVQIKNAKNNILHYWEEFPEPDPFEFVLSKILYDEKKHLRWEKCFLERKTGARSNFINVLKPFRRSEIGELLEKMNFHSVKFFKGVSPKTKSDTYIVVAKK